MAATTTSTPEVTVKNTIITNQQIPNKCKQYRNCRHRQFLIPYNKNEIIEISVKISTIMNKILIVDATASDSRVMSSLLSRAGYDPLGVDSI